MENTKPDHVISITSDCDSDPATIDAYPGEVIEFAYSGEAPFVTLTFDEKLFQESHVVVIASGKSQKRTLVLHTFDTIGDGILFIGQTESRLCLNARRPRIIFRT